MPSPTMWKTFHIRLVGLLLFLIVVQVFRSSIDVSFDSKHLSQKEEQVINNNIITSNKNNNDPNNDATTNVSSRSTTRSIVKTTSNNTSSVRISPIHNNNNTQDDNRITRNGVVKMATTTSSPKTFLNGFYYSHARHEKELDLVLWDMIVGHAYAFSHNKTYGGACIDLVNKKPGSRIHLKEKRRNAILPLLDKLDLGHVLPYDCPSTTQNDEGKGGDPTTISTQHRLKVNSELFTSEWKQYFISQWKHKKSHQQQSYQHYSPRTKTSCRNVVVHVQQTESQVHDDDNLDHCDDDDASNSIHRLVGLINKHIKDEDAYLSSSSSPSFICNNVSIYVTHESSSIRTKNHSSLLLDPYLTEMQLTNYTVLVDQNPDEMMSAIIKADLVIILAYDSITGQFVNMYAYLAAILNYNPHAQILYDRSAITRPAFGIKFADKEVLPPMPNWFVVESNHGPNRTEPFCNHTSSHPKKHHMYYSSARYDRTGSTMYDMIRGHAYAFQNNMTYGGACIDRGNFRQKNQRRKAIQPLLYDLGLHQVLPYNCPPSNLGRKDHKQGRIDPVDLFTPQWKRYFYGQWQIIRNNSNNSFMPPQKLLESAPPALPKTLSVVVHIRRGDVEPCEFPDRYFTNNHFLRLIDRYVTASSKDRKARNGDVPNITVFSESKSAVESFDAFVERGYTMMLDTPIIHVIQAIMDADIVIISKSTFSYVPAILNFNGTIIYPVGYESPLQDWILPDDEFMKRSKDELQQLRIKHCYQQSVRKNKTVNLS